MENLTPKQKFDAEMETINKTFQKPDEPAESDVLSQDEIEELDEEVEAVEQAMDDLEDEEVEFDKSMGGTKVEVTKETFHKEKQEAANKDMAAKMASVGGLKPDKLSPKQGALMQHLLKAYQEGTIADPVLKHLLEKKVELARKKVLLDVEIKRVQTEVVQTMTNLAGDVMKIKGDSELYNRDIFDYVAKNPGLVEQKVEQKE